MRKWNPVIFLLLAVCLILTACGNENDDDTFQNSDGIIGSGIQTIGKSDEKTTCFVKIQLKCEQNLIFSTYNVNLYIDDIYEAKLEHGSTKTYSVELEKGRHTLKFENEEETVYLGDIVGSVDFDVSEDATLCYNVKCTDSQIYAYSSGEDVSIDNAADIIQFEKAVHPNNNEIGQRGYTYNINTTYNYEQSNFTIHRLKLRYENPYYALYFDYTVKNNTNQPLIWSINEHDNVYGDVTTDTMTNEWLGGNTNLSDGDFDHNCRKDRGEIEPNGEMYGTMLLLFNNWDEHYNTIKLRENEHMIFNLYYTENGVKSAYTVELNESE